MAHSKGAKHKPTWAPALLLLALWLIWGPGLGAIGRYLLGP